MKYFLSKINKSVSYQKWVFSHYHTNCTREDGKLACVYICYKRIILGCYLCIFLWPNCK